LRATWRFGQVVGPDRPARCVTLARNLTTSATGRILHLSGRQ
jgi:hypothetical protein